MSTRYATRQAPGHPNASSKGQVYVHVFVMSEILGRALSKEEVVHHKDNDSTNNLPGNLQLFPNQAEHMLHHAKERALKACGNSEHRQCCYCKEYDNPVDMFISKTRYQAYHKGCAATYKKERRTAT